MGNNPSDPLTIIQNIYNNLSNPATSNTKASIAVQKLERFYNEINVSNPEIGKKILPYISSCKQTLKDESRSLGQREEMLKALVKDIFKIVSGSVVRTSATPRLENQPPLQVQSPADTNTEIDLLKKELAKVRSLYWDADTKLKSALAQNAELSEKLTAQSKRFQQTRNESIENQLSQFKEEHKEIVRGIEAAKRTVELELNQEKANNTRLQNQIRSLLSDIDGLRRQIEKSRAPADAVSICEELEQRLDRLPASLQAFVENLIWIVKQRNNLRWLASEEGLTKMDGYLYQSPQSLARLRLETDAVEWTDLVQVLHWILDLQNQMHEALGRHGITPINPSQGTPFNAREHNADETDTTWVQDRSQHNTVAAVQRLGYRLRESDGTIRVLRLAQVKRRLYSPSLSDQLSAIQDTTLSLPEDGHSSAVAESSEPIEATAEPETVDASHPEIPLSATPVPESDLSSASGAPADIALTSDTKSTLVTDTVDVQNIFHTNDDDLLADIS